MLPWKICALLSLWVAIKARESERERDRDRASETGREGEIRGKEREGEETS